MIRSKPALLPKHSVRVVAFLAAAGVLLFSLVAQAQLKPAAHLRYFIEVEPQVTLQVGTLPGKAAGIGPGLRLAVPIFHDGPLRKVNNSLAIGIGASGAFFQEPCGQYFWDGAPLTPDDPRYATWSKGCTAQQLTVPLVLQWNLFVARAVSLFVEPGMAMVYERRSGTGFCDTGPCSKSDSTTKLPFVIWGGARIGMSDSLAFTIRVGRPNVSAGLSMFF